MNRNRAKQRHLGFQALERRNLLAAHISELLVDPHFGDSDTQQYVELRGEPGESLSEGTYLVVVEESGFSEGEIHGIFDLSNQQFGSNGYLAILQQDHPYDIHPDANALVSTEVGFGGLPGNLYTDSHPLSDRIDFIIGANTYMLIESAVPPELGQDIDATDDGLIDNSILEAWKILDSISLQPFVGGGDIAYGQIVFAEIGAKADEIAVPEGVEVVHTEGFGYAGRVGESTGHRAIDWIQSTVQNESKANEPQQWGLVDNLFGTPSQYEFSGRDLDHIGEANFVGGVRGNVTVSASGEPRAGVTVLADINGNGVRDSLTYTVDPDDAVDENFPDQDYPLLNAYPGVTITNFSLDSFPSSEVTAEFERDFPNTLANRIFAKGGIDWFSTGSVLRFDFYRPVNSVSIDAIGDDNPLSETYGRIDAFNADGELVDTDLSSELVDGSRQTITVSTESDSIAYVYAYSDSEVEGGGPFGRFDRMVYSQREPAATTDENGYYDIQRLFPGDYEVSVLAPDLTSDIREVRIEKYENFVHDFGLAPNDPPAVESAEFEISEDAGVGSTLGQMSASDPNGQALTFSLGEPDGHGFHVDEVTGTISVGENAELDFETNPTVSVNIVVTDSQGASSSAVATIHVLDANESPEIEAIDFTIAESAPVGSFVGRMQASDPDTRSDQRLFFQFVNENEDFSIHPETGIITVARPQSVSVLTQREYAVQVTDSGVPAQSATANVLIRIENVNDQPLIESSTFQLSEFAEGGAFIGDVIATDADPGQTLLYSLGDEETPFAIHAETGRLTVKEGANIDYETQQLWEVIVSVTDNGSPAQVSSAQQRIEVLDENESPEISTAELAVLENSPAGTSVGLIEATDPDSLAQQSLTFSIVGGSGAEVFAVNSETGEVTVDTEELDFEQADQFTLLVEVTDNGDPERSDSREILISIGDQNEAPVIVTEVIEVAEGSDGELGQIAVEDEDSEQSHTFELIGGSGTEVLSVDSDGTIRLRPNAVLDFESDSSYTLDIRARDSGDPSAATQKTIEIRVTDVNELPAFTASPVATNAMSGERFQLDLGEDLVMDPDGDDLSITATVEDSSLPEWLHFDPITLVFAGIPTSFFAGPVEITLNVFEPGASEAATSASFELVVEVSEKPLHNTEVPHDVNGDDAITASDALQIINFIGRNETDSQFDTTVRIAGFFDVSGDNFVTALDALQIINQMRRDSLRQEPEAVSSTDDHRSVAVTSSSSDDEARDAALDAYLAEASLF